MRIRYFLAAMILSTVATQAQRSDILDFISDSNKPNAKTNIQILDLSQEVNVNLDEVIIKLLDNRVRTIVISLNLDDYKKTSRLDSLLSLHYVIARTAENFALEMTKFRRSRNKVAYKFPLLVTVNDTIAYSHCAVQAALSYNWLIIDDILNMDKETEFYIDYDGGPCHWSFQTMLLNELDEWKQQIDNKVILIADFKKEEKYITPFDEFIFYNYSNETPYGTNDFHCRDKEPGMYETYILGHMINTLLTQIPRDTESIIFKQD